MATVNREEWLARAVDALWTTVLTPAGVPRVDTRVSVGWPFGSPRKRIGECFPTDSSNDGVSHLFISPALSDPEKVLGVLLHELIHAADNCASGHKGYFAQTARKVGLEGKMTATTIGDDLAESLGVVLQALPEYPHKGLTAKARKTQSTRMIKLVCDPFCECGGYVVRTTNKWIEVGRPVCPFGSEMEVDDE